MMSCTYNGTVISLIFHLVGPPKLGKSMDQSNFLPDVRLLVKSTEEFPAGLLVIYFFIFYGINKARAHNIAHS